MKRTGFYGDQSVDYRQSVFESPTAVKAFRVTYTVPLESTAHEDFASELGAAMQVVGLLRVIRGSRRGSVTVQAL